MGKGIWIFLAIFVFLLIFLIIGAAIYLNKLPSFLDFLKPTEPEIVQIQMNYTSFELLSKDSNNIKIATDYMLIGNNTIIAGGQIPTDKLEIYNLVDANITYTLITHSKDYYLEAVTCDSSTSKCQTNNMEIASPTVNIEKKSDNLYAIKLKSARGIIRQPAICFAWTSNILYVRTSYIRIDEPREVRRNYDICYLLETVTQDKEFDIEVVFFSEVNNDKVDIILLDKVRYVNDNGIILDNYFRDGEDIGMENIKTSISFQ